MNMTPRDLAVLEADTARVRDMVLDALKASGAQQNACFNGLMQAAALMSATLQVPEDVMVLTMQMNYEKYARAAEALRGPKQ